MQSLQQVLFSLPGVLVELVESFVGLRCSGGWRAVSHQAYDDVEARAKAVLQDLGICNLNTPAYWVQVMKRTFECRVCKGHTSYAQVQGVAKANRLCDACLNASQFDVVCDVCFFPQSDLTFNTCHTCNMVACDECCDETLNMCLGCTELFCQSCITDDYCTFCS